MPTLTIACSRPGMIRGGVRHPKIAEHLLTDFSADQLREMIAEPELALVIGRPLTHADVALLEAGEQVHVVQPTQMINVEAQDRALDASCEHGLVPAHVAGGLPNPTHDDEGTAADAAQSGSAAAADPVSPKGKRRGARG